MNIRTRITNRSGQLHIVHQHNTYFMETGGFCRSGWPDVKAVQSRDDIGEKRR